MTTALIVAKQCVIMLLYMSVGYVLFKLGKITKSGNLQFAKLLMSIIIPLMMISATQVEKTAVRTTGFLIVLVISIVTHVIGILIDRLMIGDKDGDVKRRIAGFGVVYSNAGFVAIPLVKAAYGNDAAFYATAYLLIFNIISWTFGFARLTGGFKNISIKKVFFNPGVVGAVAAIVFYLANIRFPSIIAIPINAISEMNTPLAMIMCGAFAAQTKVGDYLKDNLTYKVTFLRLLLIPLVTLAVFKGISALFGNTDIIKTVIGVCLIEASCPVSVATSFMPTREGIDGEYACGFIIITTILSVVTIPFIVYLNTLI